MYILAPCINNNNITQSSLSLTSFQIFFIGCFEIDRIPAEHLFHQHTVLNNTVEGCYCECHKENISCGQNELSFFLKVTLHCTNHSDELIFKYKFLQTK